MTPPTRAYLAELTLRLSEGLAQLDESRRARHADWIRRGQRDDGGFPGREGESDLYYTGFALRSLAVLGELHGPVADRALRFLESRLSGPGTIVDLLSLVYGAFLLDMAAGLDIFAKAPDGLRERWIGVFESLRRPDGGYAKGPDGAASSTYHTFLVMICLELLDAPIPEPDRIAAFLLSQRAEGGGFLEIRAGKRAGTNPTAAAIGALRILGGLTPPVRDETAEFLAGMVMDDGGFRANSRIPISDLLSTFTGLWTLIDVGAIAQIDRDETRRFVESLEGPSGGFRAADWDDCPDVEYTFYGLGSLAVLHRL
ncbi:MAG: beta-hydroxylase [Planctomycetes bacterium]|nr:beta-hydroxylase [Planctomycetota bacterium]